MPDDPIDAEIVDEGVGAELVPAAPQPATLFRTDDPALIVEKATAVANALAGVLKARELTKRIGNKDHVLVEGWTLCGSMLGVFAVVEWTRPVEGGWEARAEARTITGAVVGAAEAECLRSENTWKSRDDYAIRSMAQTRAVSKALRAPLGFIVQLAGFEATPAEEMPPEPARSEDNAGKVTPPRSWAKVKDLIQGSDTGERDWGMFEAFVRAASYHQFGQTDSKQLTADQRKVMLQKAAGAAVWLAENVEPDGAFTYYAEADQRQAWASVLEGVQLEIPDYTPPEPTQAELEADGYDADAERLAREAFADPS